jgi:hypothetical protein
MATSWGNPVPSHPKFMATAWGNPLPSHATFSWQHLGATHFHLIAQHLGATHFHLIPHSHSNILGQPTSISSHILIATSWGNPLPSHPTFSWQHLGATHFHLIPHSHSNILGQPTSISKGKANEVDVYVLWKGLVWPVPPRKHLEPCKARCCYMGVVVVTNCTRTLFPSITSVPHH